MAAFNETLISQAAPAANEAQAFIQAPELSLVPGISQATVSNPESLPVPLPGTLPPELSLVPGISQGAVSNLESLPVPLPGTLPPELSLVPGISQAPVSNQVMNLPKDDSHAAQKKINDSAPTLRPPEKFKRTSNVFNSASNTSGTRIENMTIQTQQEVNKDSLAHMIGMGA